MGSGSLAAVQQEAGGGRERGSVEENVGGEGKVKMEGWWWGGGTKDRRKQMKLQT